MTQNELWNVKYQEILDWIRDNKRNPSKHHIEEHDFVNWIKYNRKIMKVGKMKLDRIPLFNQLLLIIEENKRVNQWD